jgi:D-aminopeptidase
VDASHVFAALDGAADGPVAEGAVGAGTGMIAYGYKAGIGSASRVLPAADGGYTVGVLVNANHGIRRQLRVDGVPVGQCLVEGALKRKTEGSIIITVATDAPLTPHQLQRVAKRAALGLARTGAVAHHGSGDIVLAFSTKNGAPRNAEGLTIPMSCVRDERLDPLYEATCEATEEAVLNAITTAPAVTGRDGVTAPALPLDDLVDVMHRHGHEAQLPTR